MDERAMEQLRKELVKLKADTLSAQAARMGLSSAGEGISPKALRTIEESVAELTLEELRSQVAHWTELSRRVAGFDSQKPR